MLATISPWVQSLLLLAVMAIPLASAQEAALLENIPGDAVAVLSIYPKEIASLPELEMFPREVITAVGLKEWGIDPLEIEKALIVAGKFDANEPPPLFAIFRFAAAESAQKTIASSRVPEKIGKLGGKELYRTNWGVEIISLDEKTIAIGQEKSLIWLTGDSKTGGPMHILLKKEPKSHLSLTIHLEPIRPTVIQAFVGAPPPLQDFAKIAALTKSAEAHFDFSLAGQSRISLHAANDKDAAEIKKIATAQLEFAAKSARTQLHQAGSSQDPVQRAWGAFLARAIQKVLELTTPAQRGAEVSLSLKNDRALTTSLGLFASTALPAMISANASAGRVREASRLKHLMLSMHNYHSSYNAFPQRAMTSPEGKPLLSWRVQLLPFLDQQALYEQFHLDEPWDSEHNKKLIDKMPDVFRAPGDAADSTTTRCQGLVGDGVLLEEKEATALANITDGTSNTIAIVQATKEKAVPWTKPDDLELNAKKPLEGLLDEEAGGFLAAFADGSVHWIPASVDEATLKALMTRAGGEVVQVDFNK